MTSKQIADRHAIFLRRYLLRSGCEIATTPDEIGIFAAITFLESLHDETRDKLPPSLRDPVAVMERGRELLAKHEAETRAAVYEFLGWLSGDIPELHNVEVPRLADSWERYRAKIDECPPEKAPAPECEFPMCHGEHSTDDVHCKATCFVQGETKRCEREPNHGGEHIVQRRNTTPFRWHSPEKTSDEAKP